MENIERLEQDVEQEKKPEIEIPKFEIKDFEMVRENLVSIIKKMIPAIRDHKYNLIVGDDVSGRIPTLIIAQLLKKIYNKDGFDDLETIFFVGGRKEGEAIRKRKVADSLRERVRARDENTQKLNALLVTEYMVTGNSIIELLSATREAGINCDVLSTSRGLSAQDCNARLGGQMGDLYLPDKIISFDDKIPFWENRGISGVHVPRSGFYDQAFAKIPEEHEAQREKVIRARKDVKKMVDYLYQIYKQELEKQNEV